MDFNACMNWIESHKHLPWTIFLLTFAILTLLEMQAEAYQEKTPRLLRWPNNILLALLNALLMRFVLPSFTVWVAIKAYGQGFGVMNWIKVPEISGFILTVTFLDWVLYYLHRLYHAIPWLWKIHRVHHTDPEVDVTTGLRFHPLELILTTLVKAGFVYLIGAPIYSVFIYEILSALFVLYDHSNVNLPSSVEKAIRSIFITPYMHRVHHSQKTEERNKNYGFIFSGWDVLFGTYKDPAKVNQLSLGLDLFHTTRFLRFKQLLLQPFLDHNGNFKWKNFMKNV